MDSYTESHLLSICTALGETSESGTFIPGDEVKGTSIPSIIKVIQPDCLRDLKTYLKQEDPSKHRPYSIQLGKWHTYENSLIPLAIATACPKTRGAVCKPAYPSLYNSL